MSIPTLADLDSQIETLRNAKEKSADHIAKLQRLVTLRRIAKMFYEKLESPT